MTDITRRKFIKNASLATGFTIVSSHVLGKTLGYTAPSDKLNIADWIEEELILSLPLVPAHEEGCQTDGPEESKDEVQKPNPFAKLKDLKGLRKV